MDPSLEKILEFRPDLVLAMPRANNQARWTGSKRLEFRYISSIRTASRAFCGRSPTSVMRSGATRRHTPRCKAGAAYRCGARSRKDKACSQHIPAGVARPGHHHRQRIVHHRADCVGRGRSITDDIAQEWPQIGMESVIARAPRRCCCCAEGA